MNFTEFKGNGRYADNRARWWLLFKEGEKVLLNKDYKHMNVFWPQNTTCTIAYITHWQCVLIFPDNTRMVLSPEDIKKAI